MDRSRSRSSSAQELSYAPLPGRNLPHARPDLHAFGRRLAAVPRPNRDGTTPEAVAPWKGDLKALWKKPVGEAHSSPVVAEGVVYAFYQPKGKNADALAAFDAKTGEMKWEKSYDRQKFNPLFGNGPRATPLVGGGKVYTLGGTGILACWDAKTGDIAWKVDTLKEFKAKNLFFGISTSPLMVGEKGGRDGRRQGCREWSPSTPGPASHLARQPTTRQAIHHRSSPTTRSSCSPEPTCLASPRRDRNSGACHSRGRWGRRIDRVLGDAARGGRHGHRQHGHGRGRSRSCASAKRAGLSPPRKSGRTRP